MKRTLCTALAGLSLVGGSGVAAMTSANAATYQVGSYVSSGYDSSFGSATSPETEVTIAGHVGYYQKFSNATLVSSEKGVYAIIGSFNAAFNNGGGLNTYGFPTSNWFTTSVAGSGGTMQYFTNNAGLTQTAVITNKAGTGQSLATNPTMYSRITANGGFSNVGWPTNSSTFLSRCGEYEQNFTKTSTLYQDGRWCPSSAYAQPIQSQNTAGAGMTQYANYNGNAVAMIQKALGIPFGTMSTTMGTQTVAAVKYFQSRNGLPVTGNVDQRTWNALGIQYPFSTSTWKAPSAVATNATAAQRQQQIVNYVKAQLGKSYLWGGTGNTGTPLGFDCAGLAIQAARSAGVGINNVSNYYDVYPTSDLSDKMFHDSELQSVSMSSLQPGDFVFYGNSSKVHHVSIYIGGGQAIQAVGSHVQTLSVYNTSGWSTIWGAKRAVSSTGSSASGVQMSAMIAGPQKVSGVSEASVILAETPLSPASASVSGNKVSGTTANLSSGLMTNVKGGQKLTVPSTSDSETLFLSGSSVVGVSKGSSVTAPSSATRAIVINTSKVAGIGVDTPVFAH